MAEVHRQSDHSYFLDVKWSCISSLGWICPKEGGAYQYEKACHYQGYNLSLILLFIYLEQRLRALSSIICILRTGRRWVAVRRCGRYELSAGRSAQGENCVLAPRSGP